MQLLLISFREQKKKKKKKKEKKSILFVHFRLCIYMPCRERAKGEKITAQVMPLFFMSIFQLCTRIPQDPGIKRRLWVHVALNRLGASLLRRL